MVENPLISVLITAFDRTNFLVRAVDSVLAQDIEQCKYEIIVVKNFCVPSMEKYLEDRGVVIMNMEDAPVGEFISKGIRRSRGEVISFLDDDDVFLPSKLSHVETIFSNNGNVAYYHNSFDIMNEKGDKVEENPYPVNKTGTYKASLAYLKRELPVFFRTSSNINLSCVSVSRSVLIGQEENLLKMTATTDNFVFYISILSGGSLVSDSEVLTRYCIHDSTSHTSKNTCELVSNTLRHELELSKNFRFIFDIAKDPITRKFAHCNLLESKFSAFLLGERSMKPTLKNFVEFSRCVSTRRAAFPMLYILGALLTRISPVIGKNIYEKYLRNKIV